MDTAEEPPEEHRIVIILHDRDEVLFTIWCGCGWMTRTSVLDDAFDYHDRHVAHAKGSEPRRSMP